MVAAFCPSTYIQLELNTSAVEQNQIRNRRNYPAVVALLLGAVKHNWTSEFSSQSIVELAVQVQYM